MASNSLLEGVVFGRRLGAFLSQKMWLDAAAGSFKMVERGPSLDENETIHVQNIMSASLGPTRNEITMQQGLNQCKKLIDCGWQARLAERILLAAIKRKKTLGAHFREDECSGIAVH